MSAFDRESRLKTNLNTTDGSYDQGLAISQAILNSSFEKLYEKCPALHSFSYDSGLAKMEGEMLPSRWIVPEATLNLGQILHVFRFKTGTLKVAGSQAHVKLDNWEVGVLCDLGQQFVGEYAEEDKEQRVFVEKELSVPGDYKLQRLYAKLASAQWNKFDVHTSKFFDDKGNPMTYEEWQKKDLMGATTFGTTLSLYGADLQKQGLSTLAVSIILTGLPQEIIPTFTPTNVTQQIYPYRDQNGESEYGDTVKGSRNCLLFLEVVKKEDGSDGQLPDARQVGYHGNFCYPPAGQPGVDGTFVLGGELFLARYLLRQLQAINEASSIYAYRNTYDSVGGWAFPIDIGRDPRHRDYKHKAYEFVKSSKERTWVYNKRSDNSTPAALDGSGRWWSSDHWSEARTIVSWQPGKAPYAKVEGEYIYYRGITFADNKQLADPSTYSKEKFTGKWTLSVRVVIEDDAPRLKLESTQDLDFLVTGEVEASPDLEPYENKKYEFRDSVKHRILSRIPVLRNNLREGFQGDHQFTFPVTGQLAFQDLTFNKEGDILAGLIWKDVDGPIVVRPPDLTDVNKLEPFLPLTDTVNFGPISWMLKGHRK
ncbi:uncharacterized protein Triagg1_578 [Trichoderma aggressivum f. europaeum]|uniref:Uncharacterized protein n=1 Tax=Trichoderma aggressivum f. europaeum TaxID=173218 RepID=A0AAE1INR1_9HYPO|nr:hypothetical protein Triagg1_578 [Trichoderma aggressivum f. europaeum]